MGAAGNSHSAENHAENIWKPWEKTSFPNKMEKPVFPTKSHRNPTEIHGKVMVRRGRLRDSVVVLGLAFTVRLSSGEDGYGVVEDLEMALW